MRPTIYIASDHAGFELKNILVGFIKDELTYEVVDCGASTYDENDDYTEYISRAARAVSDDPEHAKAIILGGSGQGEAMLANRFPEVRAAVYYGLCEEIVRLSRVHNDANVLSLGARFISNEDAKEAVRLWLETMPDSGVKYERRIQIAEALSTVNADQPQLDTLVRSLVPSLPPSSFEELEELSVKLRTVASEFQIDLVDGVFAPHVSWPFTELDVEFELEKLAPIAQQFQIEIDFMCTHPERYVPLALSLGVARMIFHEESTMEYDVAIERTQKGGCKAGLAVTNDTTFELLGAYAQQIDFVQVMGIENVGVQGQPFDERTIATVAHIRGLYPELEIAVDGAVNARTISALLRAGANRFAPGSAISKADNPAQAYKQLASLVGL